MNRLVKFLKPHHPYTIGDGASFNAYQAKALVDAGVAVYDDVKSAETSKLVKPTKSDDLVIKA